MSTLSDLRIRSSLDQQNKAKNDLKVLLSDILVTYFILHNLRNANLQTMHKKSVPCNLQIKACFHQQDKPTKMSQIII